MRLALRWKDGDGDGCLSIWSLGLTGIPNSFTGLGCGGPQ